MTDTKEQDRNPRIALSRPGGRLELKTTVDSGVVRQSFSHGRSKAVAVEVKRKRNLKPGAAAVGARPGEGAAIATGRLVETPATVRPPVDAGRAQTRRPVVLKPLTDEEKTARVRALVDSKKAEEEARQRAEENARRLAADEARRRSEEEAAVKRQAEEEARKKGEEEARRKAEEDRKRAEAEERARREAEEAAAKEAAAKEAAAKAAEPEGGAAPPAATEGEGGGS